MPSSSNSRKGKARPRTARVPHTVAPAPVPQFNVPNSDAYAPQVWGTQAGTSELTDVTVPSGQKALVRRPGVDGLIESGVLMQLDSLTALVDRKHIKRVKQGGVSQEEINANSLMKDPAEMAKVMRVVDKTLPYIIVRPYVELHFTEADDGTVMVLTTEERQARRDITGRDIIFTDQIDLGDRMFLFNFGVGGSADLERFRQQSAELLDGVDDGEDVQDETV